MKLVDLWGPAILAVICWICVPQCGASQFNINSKSPLIQNELAASSNCFGFRLLNRIGETGGNLILSPLSIFLGLAMAYMGAGGQTAEELETELQLRDYGLNGTLLHDFVHSLLKSLEEGNEDYTLLLATGVAFQQNYEVSPNFVENLIRLYHSSVKSVDFTKQDEAIKRINQWVSSKTRNKIDSLLTSPLDPSTVMTLLNAVYFKGTWKNPFARDNSTEGTFYRRGGRPKRVQYMTHSEMKFSYYKDPLTEYKFLELPYSGDGIVMLIALPHENKNPDLEMTPTFFNLVTQRLEPTIISRVVIPRFRLDYAKELRGSLKALGITHMFSPAANFTGIRRKSDLVVSSFFHKANIEVNEEGSEAAASSSVTITRLSLDLNEQVFVANHPFLFYIVDKRSGLVLFTGRVVDPQRWNS